MTVEGRRAKTQREPRRQLPRQPAWITVDCGQTRRECFVLDVSPGGAKITTDVAIADTDRFELVLVPNHPKQQPCQIVWRRGNRPTASNSCPDVRTPRSYLNRRFSRESWCTE